MGRLDNSPGGRLMRNVISSFAEYERDMIVSRTQEGKAYAKQHNPHYPVKVDLSDALLTDIRLSTNTHSNIP